MEALIGLTFFSLLLITPVAIVLILGVFKLIAWTGNALLGRNRPVPGHRGGNGFGWMLAGAVPICVIVGLLTVVKSNSSRQIYYTQTAQDHSGKVIVVNQETTKIVTDNPALNVDQIGRIRQEVLKAVQQHGGQIIANIPVEESDVAQPVPEPLLSPTVPEDSAVDAQEPPVVPAAPDVVTEAVAASGTASVDSASEDKMDLAAETNVASTETTAAPPEPNKEEPASQPADNKEATPAEDVATETSAEPEMAVVAPPETPEQRQARLAELASHISPWIRSLLSETQKADPAAATNVAEAVESSDKKIVVFQLAGPIGQKYALIPLTPAIDAALSPVTPFLKNGSLESIADSLASFLKEPTDGQAASTAVNPGTPESPTAVPPEAGSVNATVAVAEATGESVGGGVMTPAEQLSGQLGREVTPEWIENPPFHQFIVRSNALFPGESAVAPLNKAINEALPEHLELLEETLDPALRSHAEKIRLELDETTSQACVVKTFERLQSVGNEGADKQEMRFVYALVEIPDNVKTAAVQTVRTSLQRDRVTALAVIVVLGWLSICAATVSLRIWGRGGFFRKVIAIPILGFVCIPLLLAAVGTGASAAGLRGTQMPRYPWAESNKPVRIQVS